MSDKQIFYSVLNDVFLQMTVDMSHRLQEPAHLRYNMLFGHLNAYKANGFLSTFATPEAMLEDLTDWCAVNGFENFKTQVEDAAGMNMLQAWPAILY